MNTTNYQIAIQRKVIIESNIKQINSIINTFIECLQYNIYLYFISKLYCDEDLSKDCKNSFGMFKLYILQFRKILFIYELDLRDIKEALDNHYDDKMFNVYLIRAQKRENSIKKIIEDLQ